IKAGKELHQSYSKCRKQFTVWDWPKLFPRKIPKEIIIIIIIIILWSYWHTLNFIIKGGRREDCPTRRKWKSP
ncbi:MAG: hypothetical protein N7Q72_05180, partial [Spiroplasma sp. Tabriz.8]|nr:hypothetical protein [Spiroplasma sp. Tabriz.8]